MKIFGHDFNHLEPETLGELFSLEREGAIYSDHWISYLNDFRHVKIKFTAEETKEYVRSLWAYELFLKNPPEKYVSEINEIPKDIAERADSYSILLEDGEELGRLIIALQAL